MLNKGDLNLLEKILKKTEELELLYDGLSENTQDFLLNEYNGETKIHLYNFDRNITDAIRECCK